MRILYLCTFYHRAMLFRTQMDALIKRGHDVLAFNSAQYGDSVAEKFEPIMDELVKHTECWNKLDRQLFFPRQRKIEKQLEKAYDLKEFDLMHAHLLLSSGATALRMKKKYGLPYVVSVRSTDLNGFIKIPFFRPLLNRIIKEADGVLFLSNVHKKYLCERYLNAFMREILLNKSVVIGNCIETFWEENMCVEPRVSPETGRKLRILCVAKIRAVKNIPCAARAIEILRERGLDVSLTVVGENQEQAEYETIQKFSCVDLLPFKSKEELLPIYREHDIFLLPSHEETFGRVYVEAMTQGMPVLYTRNQGFDGNFPDGEVGFAVSSHSPEEIADRIEQILQSYEYISAKCLKNCRMFFEDEITEQLEQFYKNAIKNNLTE